MDQYNVTQVVLLFWLAVYSAVVACFIVQPKISDVYEWLWLHLSFPFVFLVFHSSSENLEPHSAPLEIGHPEVGRYFSEFAHSHYAANEELQMRYPEDMNKTLGVVRELYHTQTPGSGAQGHQHNHQPM